MKSISIHAPPRGATRTTKRYFPQNKIFQFTPLREGRRYIWLNYSTNSQLFQFTPLREGRRRYCPPLPQRMIYFNSRPSARGDQGGEVFNALLVDFNSRPSARGDSIFMRSFCDVEFQFTPLREGRRSFCARRSSENTFQFTPLREGRLPSP